MFCYYSHQITDITETIYLFACRLFDEMWDKGHIRQLGIHTHRATYDGYYQYDLFSGIRIDKLRAIDSTVDDIRNRYGFDTLKRACFVNDIQGKVS